MPVTSCRLAPRSLSAAAVEACCCVGQGDASKADRKNVWRTTIAYSRLINNYIFLFYIGSSSYSKKFNKYHLFFHNLFYC